MDENFFGLVLNRSDPTKPWPNVPFGSWRIWDAYVTWPYLEPERGQWNFAALDRMVDEAATHQTKILLVLAHSPKWASARPNEAGGYKPGFSAEPKRIEDWRNYVRKVGERYKGRIEGYQIWNEPSDKVHFTGTVQQAVELTCEAHRILKAIDPVIKVVSPGSAGGGRHIKYLDEYLAAGGSKCIDVVAHHFYVPRFGPEEMVPLIRQVREVMRKQNVGNLPLWNTETGWWIENTDGSPDHPIVARGGWRKLDSDVGSGALIQRSFLIARAEGVDRFFWYSWASEYGWSLSDKGGLPKPATKYWVSIEAKMRGSEVRSCTYGVQAFSCELQIPGNPSVNLRWVDSTAKVRLEGANTISVGKEVLPH